MTDTFDSKTVPAKILALEASANQLSVAVMIDGKTVAERQHSAPHGHAVGIVPLSIDAMQAAGLGFDAITHVAAGCGPGSFTGIRVTLAAAKGFCLAHQAVGIGLSGLQALAGAASHVEPAATTPCLAVADTRRGSLYAQLFDTMAQPMGPIFEASIAQIPALIAPQIGTGAVRLLGVDGDLIADALSEAGLSCRQMALDEMPSARMIAELAVRQIASGNLPPLEPLYLADPRLGPPKKNGKKTG